MSKSKALLALAAAAGAAATIAPAPAHAAGAITVTSPSCGQVRMANTTASQANISFDTYDQLVADAGKTVQKAIPGGTYTWVNNYTRAVGKVTVAPCFGGVMRSAPGDFTGDQFADVHAITTTGDLYAYESTPNGLVGLGKVGSGWGSVNSIQRVNDLKVGSEVRARTLIAVTNTNQVLRYDLADGGIGGGGTALTGPSLAGYTNITVVDGNNLAGNQFGDKLLVAVKDGNLYGFHLTGTSYVPLNAEGIQGGVTTNLLGSGFSGTTKLLGTRDMTGKGTAGLVSIKSDGTMWRHDIVNQPFAGVQALAAPVRIGSGWGQMDTVAAPGSVTSTNGLTDIVARNSNGNLYSYKNSGSGALSAAVQIGQRWGGIRVLG